MTADPSQSPEPDLPPTAGDRLRRMVMGEPKDVRDKKVFHQISLIAFLAWVGLGADGLSSSSYGPEEAFKTLGEYKFLAVALAGSIAATVFIISFAYSNIIKHFPFGGGGYVVASKLLGPRAGVVSGSALIIDYVLTITTSISAGADAAFSFAPESWVPYKLWVEFAALGLLVLMNLRGVKESVKILTPIFITFVVTHIILIVGTIVSRATEFPVVSAQIQEDYSAGLEKLKFMGMLLLLMKAYSMGAGTYTGIEAVSNGLMIMREPKVETAKRTMRLMAISLSLTAGGIILAYLLMHVSPTKGMTMNAVLAGAFADGFKPWGLPVGHWFVLLTLMSEALLLFVAAQAGFIDGPRVMANMASDSYLPHRFSQLSDRLTMHYGVALMGGASLAALWYTHGDVGTLLVMYAINVFVTFSLSQLAMCRFFWRDRRKLADWKKNLSIHVLGLTLCVFILVTTIIEKFEEGAWKTLLVTGLLIAACFIIRQHYRKVVANLQRLDEILPALPTEALEPKAIVPTAPTAILLVGSYAGLGIHSLLNVQRLFPNHFKNFIFLSVGVIDSATFKGVEEVEAVTKRTEDALVLYVKLAHRLGLPADYRMSIGTEAVAEAEALCKHVALEFPRSIFFAGKLIFEKERWYQRLLHNETANQLQRKLQFNGLNTMVLPVRVLT